MNLTQAAVRRPSSTGFSLAEIMVVIGIIVLLSAVSGPVMRSMRTAQNPASIADSISNFLKQARAFAVSNRTHVAVGFGFNATDQSEMILAGFYSREGDLDAVFTAGSVSDTSEEGGSDPMGKPLIFKGFTIDTEPMEGMEQDQSLVSMGELPPGAFSRRVLGREVDFRYTFLILSDGQLRTKLTYENRTYNFKLLSVPRILEIGVDHMKPGSRKEGRFLRMSGTTGRIEIVDPYAPDEN